MECLRKKWDGDRLYHYHAAPTMVSNYFQLGDLRHDELTDYFRKDPRKVQFKQWFAVITIWMKIWLLKGKTFRSCITNREFIKPGFLGSRKKFLSNT